MPQSTRRAMPSLAGEALRFVAHNKKLTFLTAFALYQLARWLRGDDEEREALAAEEREAQRRARQRKRKAMEQAVTIEMARASSLAA